MCVYTFCNFLFFRVSILWDKRYFSALFFAHLLMYHHYFSIFRYFLLFFPSNPRQFCLCCGRTEGIRYALEHASGSSIRNARWFGPIRGHLEVRQPINTQIIDFGDELHFSPYNNIWSPDNIWKIFSFFLAFVGPPAGFSINKLNKAGIYLFSCIFYKYDFLIRWKFWFYFTSLHFFFLPQIKLWRFSLTSL